jgi:hypothetical protein
VVRSGAPDHCRSPQQFSITSRVRQQFTHSPMPRGCPFGQRTAPHLKRRGQRQQLRRRHFGGRGFSFRSTTIRGAGDGSIGGGGRGAKKRPRCSRGPDSSLRLSRAEGPLPSVCQHKCGARDASVAAKPANQGRAPRSKRRGQFLPRSASSPQRSDHAVLQRGFPEPRPYSLSGRGSRMCGAFLACCVSPERSPHKLRHSHQWAPTPAP